MFLRSIKFLLFTLISFLTITPFIVSAESITNNNGIVISEEEYANFSKVYSEGYIMTMTEEKYNKLKTMDFDNIQTSTIYVESTYNPHLNITNNRTFTEEEYNRLRTADSNSSTRSVYNDSTYTTTTSKKLTLSFVAGTNVHTIVVATTWLVLPNTRSYDVIGILTSGFNVINGTQTGEQVYKLNGTYQYVNYSWNGTNTKTLSNGYGTSMNLVDNTSITYFQLVTECEVTASIAHPAVYASYQHATSNVTLAQSQNYTISSTGMGGVFSFGNPGYYIYDAMPGVYLVY